jgi:hypothetical protein
MPAQEKQASASPVLRTLCIGLGLERERLGYESGGGWQPAHLFFFFHDRIKSTLKSSSGLDDRGIFIVIRAVARNREQLTPALRRALNLAT